MSEADDVTAFEKAEFMNIDEYYNIYEDPE